MKSLIEVSDGKVKWFIPDGIQVLVHNFAFVDVFAI